MTGNLTMRFYGWISCLKGKVCGYEKKASYVKPKARL